MERERLKDLVAWKDSPHRKPLLLLGARQVGKTWLLKEFGRTHFKRVAYVNFERHPELGVLFEGAFDFRRILTGLQAASGVQIVAGETLVILDEIQLCGAALTGLKYWQEEHNDYAVAAAGSLVGLSLMDGTGYPVGKTNTMTLYPMTFGEFLVAIGEEALWELVESGDPRLLTAFGAKLRDLLKTYLLVGGMPAAVETYVRTLSLSEVRAVQTDILSDYARDFSKHAPKDIPDDFWEDFDWEREENGSLIRDGRQLMKSVTMGDLYDYYYCLNGFGEHLNFIGYPCEDGSGNAFALSQKLAVSNKCKNKDAAWEFLRYFMLPDSDDWYWGFPLNQEKFDNIFKEAMKEHSYTDWSTGEVIKDPQASYIDDNGDTVEIYALSEEARDMIIDLINRTNKIYDYDESIMNIVMDGPSWTAARMRLLLQRIFRIV